MKQIIIVLALSFICTNQISAQNKEMVVDNNDLFAPFRTVYRHVEDVDFSTSGSSRQGERSIKQHVYQRSNWMNDNYYKELTGKKTSGSSRKGISFSSNDYSTVRVGSSTKGKSFSDRNMEARRRYVDRQAAFARKRRLEQEEARRRAEEKRRREKMLDDQRVDQATDKANARMQRVTDARIARDRYNAGEGLQNAIEASRSSANSRMRGAVKPRRVMHQPKTSATGALHKQHAKRNEYTPAPTQPNSSLHPKLARSNVVLKQPKPYVYRKVQENGKYEFTGRMTKTSIYIEPDPRFGVSDKYSAPKTVASNEGFRLSPNAVVTTGQLMDCDALNMKKLTSRRMMSMAEMKEREAMFREFFPHDYRYRK